MGPTKSVVVLQLVMMVVAIISAALIGTTIAAHKPCQQKDDLFAFKDNLGNGPYFADGSEASGKDCCAWNGVRCNADGMVTAIVVDTNDTTSVGVIPDNLAKFTAMETLAIGATCPTSAAPYRRVSSPSPSLGTKLYGKVPPVLGQIPNIEALILPHNGFDSGIESLASLAKLEALDLGHNLLSGSLPSALPPALKGLSLADNQFRFNMSTAVLPTGLTDIDLSGNQIYWTISKQVNDLKNLNVFMVRNNLLFGKIPSGLSKMPASAFENNICLCDPPLPPCPAASPTSPNLSLIMLPSPAPPLIVVTCSNVGSFRTTSVDLNYL